MCRDTFNLSKNFDCVRIFWVAGTSNRTSLAEIMWQGEGQAGGVTGSYNRSPVVIERS